MTARAAVAVAVVVAVVLIPPAGFAVRSTGPSPTVAAASRVTTDAIAVPAGTREAPLPAHTPLSLELTLPFSNASRLAQLLAAVSDPASPGYRHFLTYAQFIAEFGPSPTTVTDVESTLVSSGATVVRVAPGGLGVEATLPASAVARLLRVSFVRFPAPGGSWTATAVGAVTLPPSLQGRVTAVNGLTAYGSPPMATVGGVPAPTLVEESAGAVQYVQNGTAGEDWFFGSDYTQAYGATALLPGNRGSVTNATYPYRVAVATLLASGYNTTNSTDVPPWSPSVVSTYFNDTFPASWPRPNVTGVRVDVPSASPPPLPGPLHGQNDSTGFDIENSLDLEMAGSLAPGVSLYNFYFSGELLWNPETWSYSTQYFTDDLGSALAYNYSPAHLAVISCSFGEDDTTYAPWNADLAMAAMMGVTVVAASGDQGDAPGVLTGRSENMWPLWPATAAFNTSGAISVGGVSLALSGIPTSTYTAPPLQARYDPDVEGIANATAWWDTSGGIGHYAGTEGGTSLNYSEPPWQFHSAAQPPIVNATEREGFGQLGRAGPDVAFPANCTIVYVWSSANGTPYFAVLGGTSVAAPVFAGLLADVVAVDSAGQPQVTGLGFLDPELYRIGSYFQAFPSRADPFLPVLYGSNELFSAGPDWNPTDGWGGLYAPLFLFALRNATVANYSYTGPTPTLPGTSPTPTSPETWLVLAAAASLVVAAALAVYSRRAGRLPPHDAPASSSYPPAVGAPLGPAAPSGTVVTFSCPYCGVDRPAEPGRCPKCGAM